MNKKGRISRGFGRMAVASTLALSTTAGVVVAPQMSQIAHADEAKLGQAQTLSSDGISTSVLTITKDSDGKYTFDLVYQNKTRLPLINPKLTIDGLSYDAANSTIAIGDYRYSKQNPKRHDDWLDAGGRFVWKLTDADGAALLTGGQTAVGIQATGKAGSRSVVGAYRDETGWNNGQSEDISKVHVVLKGVSLVDGKTPKFTFSAVPGTILTSTAWKNGGNDSRGVNFANAINDLTNNSVPVEDNRAYNVWNLMNIRQRAYSASEDGSFSGAANATINQLSTYGDKRSETPSTDSSGNNIINSIVDETPVVKDSFADFTNLRKTQRGYYHDNAEGNQTAVDSAKAINSVMGGSTDSGDNSYTVADIDYKAAAAYIDTLKSIDGVSTDDQAKIDAILKDLQDKVTAGTATALDVAKAIAKAEVRAGYTIDDEGNAQPITGDPKKTLSDDDKDNIVKTIDEGKTGGDVKDAMGNLDIAKLGNLKPEQRNSYIEQAKANEEDRKAIAVTAPAVDATMKGGETKDQRETKVDGRDAKAAKAYIDTLKTKDGVKPSDVSGIKDIEDKLDAKVTDKTATALDIAKAIAEAEIQADPNLTDDQKADAIKKIEDAPDGQGVIDAKNNAGDLKSTKESAKDAIDKLPGLSDDQKDSYKKQIDDAQNAGEVKDIKDGAKNVDDSYGNPTGPASQQPGKGYDVKAAEEAIDKMTGLNDDQKKEEKAKLTESDGKTPKTAGEIAKVTTEAAKKDAEAIIDGLEGLTQDQKDSYKKQVEDAKSPKEVQNIRDGAKNVSDAALNPNGDSASKPGKDSDVKAAKEAIEKMTGLTDQQKKDAEAKLTTDAEGKNPATAGVIAKAVTDAAKDNATKRIGELTNLTDAQKDSYKKQIAEDTTTGAKAEEILAGAINVDNADANAKALDSDKTAGIASIEAAAKRSKTARPDKMQQFRDEVNNAQTALDVAKAVAKAEIEANDKLSPEQKDLYEKAIDDAKNREDIQKVLDEVKNLTDPSKEGEKASSDAVTNAKAALGEMKNLVDGQVASYKDDLDKGLTNKELQELVNNASNINKVQGGDDKSDYTRETNQHDKDAAVKGVDGLLKDGDNYKPTVRPEVAQKIHDEAAAAKTALDVAKAIAKAKIEANDKLTPEQKDAAEGAIEKAEKPSDVKNIVDNPTSVPSTGDKDSGLDPNQQKAGNIIDALPLSNDRKKDYKDQVAKTTDPSQILSIVRDAALEAINNSGMTDDQKKDATSKVNNGDDIDQIGTVVAQYSDMKTALERAKKLLDEAATVRAGDNYTKASDSLKRAYDDAISALQEKYNTAKAAYDAGTESSVTAADLAQYSDKVEAARDALTPAAGNGGSSLSSGPALWVWILGLLGLVGGVLGWGYVHDADFRAVVDGAIANVQRALGIIR
ncbi:MAG: hypothetical protein Q3962_05790 [Corynebacterium sp.]|nr:hypothetical protein [Corynebacterium sp.]